MRIVELAAMVAATTLGCGKPQGSHEHVPVHLAALPAAHAEGQPLQLHGAGATFPQPLYSRWIVVYQKRNPGVQINYEPIGSEGGIRRILEHADDFGASDSPMTDEELAKAKAPILHVPMAMGAVALIYNLPELKGTSLHLTPEIIGGVFLGDITRWNDGALKVQNPGVHLPDAPINVVYRSDGSGTTSIFSEYLSTVDAKWKEKVGAGRTVGFPVGSGAIGSDGVSGQVKASTHSVGYVEWAHAIEVGLPYASVRNLAGKFVEPSVDGIGAAATNLADKIPEDMRTFLVNGAGPSAYPIVGFTYALIYREQPSAARGKALAEFLWWGTHEGQSYCSPLHYARLPAEIVTRIERQLRLATADGHPLLAPQ